jgi:hypothetical protein
VPSGILFTLMAASQVYPTPQLTIAGLLKRDFGTSFWTAHWR